MLVTLKEVLLPAQAEKRGVVAPNFVDLFTAFSQLRTAERLEVPVILSYHRSFEPLMEVTDFHLFTEILRREAERARIPVVLHLDHTSKLEDISLALEAGFTSVMYDGSMLPFHENVANTKRVVSMAGEYGASVEAELGHVPGQEGDSAGESLCLTDPMQARQFAELTNIDALAVSIGTVHGNYNNAPSLRLDLLDQIRERVKVPLVLHGSSGLDPESIRQTIRCGVCKVNLFTDLLNAMSLAARKGKQDYMSQKSAFRCGLEEKMAGIIMQVVK